MVELVVEIIARCKADNKCGINTNCARKSDYPFDKYKISKFDVTTQKRAIAKTEMLKFTETFQPIGQKKCVELSKDIFIFSYLCGGINFTDIANLTRENIVNGRLHYIRQITGKSIKNWHSITSATQNRFARAGTTPLEYKILCLYIIPLKNNSLYLYSNHIRSF